MMRSAAVMAAAISLTAAPAAQNQYPDLSGRWQLVEPTAAERAVDTLAIIAPDELLITQTPLAITIEQPSTRGTHPSAGTLKFVVGGTISSTGSESRFDAGWIGQQLTINSSTSSAPDQKGDRITHSKGSMWTLEADGRLAIDFTEKRSGEFARMARRIYVRNQ
jgi:hypothetical protein